MNKTSKLIHLHYIKTCVFHCMHLSCMRKIINWQTRIWFYEFHHMWHGFLLAINLMVRRLHRIASHWHINRTFSSLFITMISKYYLLNDYRLIPKSFFAQIEITLMELNHRNDNRTKTNKPIKLLLRFFSKL